MNQSTHDPRGALTVATIAADSALLARVLSALTAGGLRVIAHARDPQELAASRDGRAPDVVVVASTHLGGKHLAWIRVLPTLLGDVRIVVVAGSWDRRSIGKAIRDGADGLVTENRLDESLAPAVRDVCSGQLSLPRELRETFTKPLLSPREKQILAMVVMGFSNGEIAGKLYLTESTVKSHLSSAFAKLGVRSRKEATAAILDPERGLGTGILAISEDERRADPASSLAAR